MGDLPPLDLAPWATERDQAIRRFFVFLVCAAGIAAGVWYARNAGWWPTEQDTADDEPDEATPEGFGFRRGGKKVGPRPKKKTGEPRSPRGEGVAHERPPGPAGPSGPSYESAVAENNQLLAPGTKELTPDLTDAELSGPMRRGTFLDACGVPGSTKVTVKVAIRNGRAVGVSVYATPPNREAGWCVEKHVRGLQWPANGKLDSFVTTY